MIAALERTEVRGESPGEVGRVAVLDLLRARTPRFEVVFVLGLEEGSLPRRSRRRRSSTTSPRRARRAARAPRQVSRDRYLFYTACTRAIRRLYLVREAVTDEGATREPSPFWEEVAAVFDPEDVAHATTRRPLGALTWPLERRPATASGCARWRCCRRATPTRRDGVADANGWQRRLDRARGRGRARRASQPELLERLAARATFAVTELERFADCSSAWLHERIVAPKRSTPRSTRCCAGQVAHQTLFKFYAGLPREPGVDA